MAAAPTTPPTTPPTIAPVLEEELAAAEPGACSARHNEFLLRVTTALSGAPVIYKSDYMDVPALFVPRCWPSETSIWKEIDGHQFSIAY